jgi:hypothetical protein
VTRVDLSDADVIDNHSHPFRMSEVVARDPATFVTRVTSMGEHVYDTAELGGLELDEHLWASSQSMSTTTMLATTMCRWLGSILEVEPTIQAVSEARAARLAQDPNDYIQGLLEREHIRGVLMDERWLRPPVMREEFAADIGRPAFRVARLEHIIPRHLDGSFDDLVFGFRDEVEAAADDPFCVAYKCLIAYYAGLDVGDPTVAEADEAFSRWQADGWRDSREHGKPVRDYLLREALRIAKHRDRPVHIHCAVTRFDIEHSRPNHLWPLLESHQHQPIVLIHGGNPWILEAAAMALQMPNVYVDVSGLIPWSWGAAEWSLEMLLGHLPGARVLYGSDQTGEPESLWLAARFARETLMRVLARYVDRDHLTVAEATKIGRMVLSENTQALHGIGPSQGLRR